MTYDVLKRTLCCLWLGALLFTYSPLFGFGLYFDFNKEKCTRYRFAIEFKDKIYAWFNFTVGKCMRIKNFIILIDVFSIGFLVCLSIALCNIAVVLELSKIRSQNRVIVRRISRSLIVNNRTGVQRHHQTPEEVAFAKLMAYISIIFCVCWGPQIVSIDYIIK